MFYRDYKRYSGNTTNNLKPLNSTTKINEHIPWKTQTIKTHSRRNTLYEYAYIY